MVAIIGAFGACFVSLLFELAAVAKQARYDGAALYNKQEITEEVAFTIL